jgi:hypothetical protein
MTSIIWLIFSHYIGDIALQSSWQAENKSKYWYVMLSHCMIWTACVCIALQYLGLFEYWKVLFLVVGHGLMDEWKCHQPHERELKVPDYAPINQYNTFHIVKKSNWWMIYPDQAWHFIQLLIVYFL